jgi:S-formylglutathione hydrolase FrmB
MGDLSCDQAQRPTRRHFLLGIAVLAAGCAGRSTANRRSAGAVSGTAAAKPTVSHQVVSGHMTSSHMNSPVGWTVAWPPGPATGVVYCLHGKGDDHRFAFDEIHLPDVAAAAASPLIIAAVDGGKDSYWHPRADGTDAMAMLVDEFIPMVDDQLPAPVPRAVLGWSMGGYGALLIAERHPAMFRSVTAVSPALWTSPGATAPGAFDSPADYRRYDVFAGTERLDSLAVRVDCGTGDPFFQSTRQFVTRLPAGHRGGFEPGSHTPTYWRSVAPAEIVTIADAFRTATPPTQP